MFHTENVHVTLRRIQLSLEEVDDNARIERLCACTFRIGLLTYEIARTVVGVALTRHCFDRHEMPSWETDDVSFHPPLGVFTVSLRTAPDMPEPLAVLKLAQLQKVRVWRPVKEKRDLALEFVTRHPLQQADVMDLAAVLAAWEVGRVCITFANVQTPLDLEADDSDPPATSARAH